MLPEYRNEPFTDFTDPENIKRMEQALGKVQHCFDDIVQPQRLVECLVGPAEGVVNDKAAGSP